MRFRVCKIQKTNNLQLVTNIISIFVTTFRLHPVKISVVAIRNHLDSKMKKNKVKVYTFIRLYFNNHAIKYFLSTTTI